MWPKGKSIEDAIVIGEEEGVLYKLKGHSETTFVHEITSPSELWHRKLAHINYKALPHVRKVVMGLPYLNIALGTDVQKERTSRIRLRIVRQRLKVRWN